MISIIEMVFHRNYSFDFLREGYNHHPYIYNKKNSIQISVSWFFASESGQSQESNIFSTFVEIQSHFSP